VLQDHQKVVTSLKAQASKPAEAHALAPNGSRQACQGCTVAQQAVEELRQQLAPLRRSLSEEATLQKACRPLRTSLVTQMMTGECHALVIFYYLLPWLELVAIQDLTID